MARYLYSELANLTQARKSCLAEFKRSGVDNGWFDRHTQKIDELISAHMPSGSGFDNGTTLDLDASHGAKLVFTTAFHHMTEGFYSSWTEHTITVTPSFIHGFHMRVSGRNKNDIKDYVGDTFAECLKIEV